MKYFLVKRWNTFGEAVKYTWSTEQISQVAQAKQDWLESDNFNCQPKEAYFQCRTNSAKYVFCGEEIIRIILAKGRSEVRRMAKYSKLWMARVLSTLHYITFSIALHCLSNIPIKVQLLQFYTYINHKQCNQGIEPQDVMYCRVSLNDPAAQIHIWPRRPVMPALLKNGFHANITVWLKEEAVGQNGAVILFPAVQSTICACGS